MEQLEKAKKTFAAGEGCTNQMDICFLIDASGSIGTDNFQQVQKYLHSFFSVLPIGDREVNTALVTFSGIAHRIWDLRSANATDKDKAMEAVLRLPYDMGTTNTADGLRVCREALFTTGRTNRKNVTKVVILMTDGDSNVPHKTEKEAKRLREMGAFITVLAVGHYINHSECRRLCGCYHDSEDCSLYLRTGWGQLMSAIQPMLTEVCKKLPKDAVCSDWSEWSPCSVTCGTGSQTRERDQLSNPEPGTPTCDGCDAPLGRTCEAQGGLKESRACDKEVCPVNAGCGEWGEWSPWSSSCGAATRRRERTRYNNPPPVGKGLLCNQQIPPREKEEVQATQLAACVITPPAPPEWGAWSMCTVTCGGGTRYRVRDGLRAGLVVVEEGSKPRLVGTNPWPQFDLFTTETCNTNECPVDATCGDFGPWSECSATCGGGVSRRTRSPWNDDAKHGGKTCWQQYKDGPTETMQCGMQNCPVDEKPGEWQEWGPCDVTCGSGKQTRRRGNSILEAQYGGRTISKQNETLPEGQKILLEETTVCHLPPCGGLCTYPWSEWSSCQGCDHGRGFQRRETAVKYDYQNGKCEQPTSESQPCSCGGPTPVPLPPASEEAEVGIPSPEREGDEETYPSGGEGPRGGGVGEISGGVGEISGGVGETSGGVGETNGGMGETNGGMGETNGGMGETSGGMGETSGGVGETNGGMGETSGGMGETNGGMGETSGGVGETSGGMGETSGGMGEISGGMGETSGGMGETSGGAGGTGEEGTPGVIGGGLGEHEDIAGEGTPGETEATLEEGAPGTSGTEGPPGPEISEGDNVETTTSTEEPKNESEGGGPAAIAGGVIGGVALLAAAGGGAYYFLGSSGAEAVSAVADMEFDTEGGTRVTMEEEKEAMVHVDDESGMWADDH
ncbi:microneme protein MIC2 [Besnoitia besnoiti]|uniref:Microneme protein MIC2 n=1 Tax=Besnoitia besnoiti TaxID=94643 RepID=A0A2A9M6F0_BESBE|nr:microneme protein MIC2 [Besnoitia besnoiti]PFH32764.1 microneme protein MIC2 [Besnoitia besnoiti]